MPFQAPESKPGYSSDNSGSDLEQLSTEELIAQIHHLQSQLAQSKNHSSAGGGTSSRRLQEQSHSPVRATFTGEDGYEVIHNQRIAVLVDVQNMYYAARNLFNSKLEFSKLLHRLTKNRVLSRAIAYVVERPGMEQEKFIEVLKRNGYEVRKKLLIERSDGSQKGDWDLGMAMDAVAMSDKVDVVCIVTGDGDFVTLCEFLQTRGIRVEVGSFPETTAMELIRSCNYYHRLSEEVLLPSGQFVHSEENDSSQDIAQSANPPSRNTRGPKGSEYSVNRDIGGSSPATNALSNYASAEQSSSKDHADNSQKGDSLAGSPLTGNGLANKGHSKSQAPGYKNKAGDQTSKERPPKTRLDHFSADDDFTL